MITDAAFIKMHNRHTNIRSLARALGIQVKTARNWKRRLERAGVKGLIVYKNGRPNGITRDEAKRLSRLARGE